MANAAWSERDQSLLRNDIFLWLDEQMRERGGMEIHHTALKAYKYQGERMPLIDTSRGLRNPEKLSSTLSVRTTVKGHKKYEDFHDGEWVTYSFPETDGLELAKLRRAFDRQDPIIYFEPIREGFYLPYFPVYISEFDTVARVIRFSIDTEVGVSAISDTVEDPMKSVPKSYTMTQTRRRVHQPLFRIRVLSAYSVRCAVCGIERAELLDAAHIIPDSYEHGVPEVSNGLALCKLHHAAYDRNLVGITGGYKIQLSKRVELSSPTGVMLAIPMERTIHVPRSLTLKPRPELLDERYSEFVAAQ